MNFQRRNLRFSTNGVGLWHNVSFKLRGEYRLMLDMSKGILCSDHGRCAGEFF